MEAQEPEDVQVLSPLLVNSLGRNTDAVCYGFEGEVLLLGCQ